MIANCPSCGTHYKHAPPTLKVRGRCGRCASMVDLSRLRPYRIATASAPRPEDAEAAASYSPIGLDHPALATAIARNVAQSAAPPSRLQPSAPVPTQASMPTPQAAGRQAASEFAVEPRITETHPVQTASELISAGKKVAAIAFWAAAGAIAGTGTAWTMDGTMMPIGAAAGAVLGAAAAWGWLRWTSPK